MNRRIIRGIAATTVGAMLIVGGTLGATAIRNRATPHPAGPANTTANVSLAATPVIPDSAFHRDSVVTSAPVTVSAAAPTHAASSAPLSPVVPRGESGLPNGITATRADAEVVVSFDLPMSRTRVPERFERLLRNTLPDVYGPAATTLLSALPSGAIAQQGDLLTELPTRGVRIPVTDGWELRVYPETRPGHDGPLVIRYRALLAPPSE